MHVCVVGELNPALEGSGNVDNLQIFIAVMIVWSKAVFVARMKTRQTRNRVWSSTKATITR